MTDDTQLFCTFQLAGRLFGMPLTDIKEVTSETNYTRIPHAPKSVLGLVNIRGNIILALDLRHMLQLTSDDSTGEERLVILKPSVGPSFGLMVEGIGEIAALPRDDGTMKNGWSHASESNIRSDLINRVGKLEDQLLIVLDPRKFLPLIEHDLQRNTSRN